MFTGKKGKMKREVFSDSYTEADRLSNQSGAWYAEAVDRAVIRKLEKIKTSQGFKNSCNKVKGKFAMDNTTNVL